MIRELFYKLILLPCHIQDFLGARRAAKLQVIPLYVRDDRTTVGR